MNKENILKYRLKIIIGMILAIVVTFLVLFLEPKQNDIPVMPLAVHLKLFQRPEDKTLELKDISLIEGYAPDYQTDMQANYYQIELREGNRSLFKGKTIKSHIKITENLIAGQAKSEVEESLLNDFTLDLPYYKNADALIFSDESGNEMLQVDLKKQNLTEPMITQSCGDGVCTDNENMLICYSDCSYKLRRPWKSSK